MRYSILLTALALAPVGVTAQSTDDSAAVVATAHDYIDGLWQGDSARVRRAVHAELAKRQIMWHDGKGSHIPTMSADQLVAVAGRQAVSEVPVAERKSDVTVLSLFRNSASVRIDAGRWVDFVHLARYNGEWKVVNILWETAESD